MPRRLLVSRVTVFLWCTFEEGLYLDWNFLHHYRRWHRHI